jgi:hypothetical protein
VAVLAEKYRQSTSQLGNATPTSRFYRGIDILIFGNRVDLIPCPAGLCIQNFCIDINFHLKSLPIPLRPVGKS